jgi:hypothetical protein
MIFNGINSQKLELRLIPFDPHEFELMTGFKVEDSFQPTIVDFNLIIGNKDMYSSILISDVIELIDWFEKFLLNKTVDSHLSIYHGQLCFDLLNDDADSKTIRITHDGSIPIPGNGGYSGNLDYMLKTHFVEYEISLKELNRIIIDLKKELCNALKK